MPGLLDRIAPVQAATILFLGGVLVLIAAMVLGLSVWRGVRAPGNR